MTLVTLRNPDTGEQVAVDDPAPYEGWEQIAEGLPLADLQADLWERVKALRASRKAAGVTIPGVGTVQTDDVSTQNITGLVVMAQVAVANELPFSEPFTMADNTVVTFDAAGMIGMGVAVAQFVAAVYGRARALREAIFAEDATVEGLAALDVEAGWPA